ncbi:MAG: HAD hydrolase family protein [Candidatus Cloacimonetes bacterium]|nr:HAD hydrolase family protein [Candidatus Cloacimonadota bacterium]
MKDYSQIKLLILDCDGVLTDGKVIYGNNEIELKSFSATDGLGIRLLEFSDIKVIIVTGRESEALIRRCKDLRIECLFQKTRNKFAKIQEILKELNLTWHNVAYMGDDWNDYPAIKKAYLSAVPNDANEDIKTKVDFIANFKGGEGAVREFIDFILKKQGKYEKAVADFIEHLENS